jgi:hypothetical protein
MARIIVGSYMIRYPLGGMLSWSLQWLVGLHRLGHDVYFVEKGHYGKACFNPVTRTNDDDPSYGISVVDALFRSCGLQDRWCFVDFAGNYHGCSRARIEALFRVADLFLDIGSHGAWMNEAEASRMRVLVDGEPGYNQMKMEIRANEGETEPRYDWYYTNGANVGKPAGASPTAGHEWRAVYNPVVLDLFECAPGSVESPVTTVMNWQAHAPLTYNGVVYGQKDVEFAKFIDLPGRTSATMEVAVAGSRVPTEALRSAGWRIRRAHDVTITFDEYRRYIASSSAEFSVCKSAYVSTNSGWFSDRSAAYLASGRPVTMQETGFSAHLPCGEGLFAPVTVDDAAAAVESIRSNYAMHSRRAKEIAREYLDARRVLPVFLGEIGI